jgi:hypothetical protein
MTEKFIFNPFKNVPLNTLKVYVRGITNTGCQVFLPINNFDHEIQIERRDELQRYLYATTSHLRSCPPDST